MVPRVLVGDVAARIHNGELMSKMKRVKPPDFLNGDSKVQPLDAEGLVEPVTSATAESVPAAEIIFPKEKLLVDQAEGFVDLVTPAKTIADAADRKPLAKVEVNDSTPRCPICRSVRINEIRLLGSFNRFACIDCQASFRNPVFGAAA